MNPRTILLALAALTTAGLTAFLVHGWMERQRAQMAVRAPTPVQEDGISVLVAKSNLGAGSFIQPGDIRWQVWPEGSLSPSYIIKGKRQEADFLGSVVRVGIVAGQPITDNSVVKVGERGFLSAVLKPGMRAIAVPVNAASAIAGLVFPGDRVDLILTHKFEVQDEDKNARKLRQASETVLMNVRILAIDQRMDDQKGDGKKKSTFVPKTTTLEVTPKQAEIVNVALTLGQLSLSLRSLAKTEQQLKDGKSGEELVVKRGRTRTRDSEVSGLLSGGAGVTVLRGASSDKGQQAGGK